MDSIYTLKRYKKKKNNSKYLLIIIFMLLALIFMKGNYNLKELVNESKIHFIKIKNYLSTFFNNEIINENKKDYIESVMLNVKEDYLVKAQNSGIVVFIGDKEGYGNSVIIQQVDGIDLIYGNLMDINVDLYDYVKKDEIIANAKDKVYLVYTKEGKIINNEEYNKN